MEKNNFIIEVKTKWVENKGIYSRDIIEYTCPLEFDFKDESIYTKFLEPTKVYKEESTNVESNEIEIKAISKDSHSEIETPSTLVKTLLEFTKYQWLKGE